MYHPINEPHCSGQLNQLIELARLTIGFALNNDRRISRGYSGEITEQKALAAELSQDLFRYGGMQFLAAVRAGFISHFASAGRQDAGEWLWQKPAAVAAPVVRLLVVPLKDKRRVLAAFDSDLDLPTRFAHGSFEYGKIPPAGVQARDLAASVLHNFYSDILAGSGVPGRLFGQPETFNRQTVLRSYLDANRQVKVCPGCDGDRAELSGGRIYTDFDHFFPVSRYPFLAIHPMNLTPYCEKCNQRFKGTKDVFAAPGVQSLADIYHPYLRPAHNDVEVVVERSPADNQPHMHLRDKSTDPRGQTRLASLNFLLDLESRWDGDLSKGDLSDRLESALFHGTQTERDRHDPFDKDVFDNKLAGAIKGMRFSSGRMEGQVPAKAYAEWVARDDIEHEKWYRKLEIAWVTW